MSSRSERYRAKAEKYRQHADAARIPGTKRLYEVMASQWQHLAEQADSEVGTPSLLENNRYAERH
jgi:hypothetical protein